MELIHYLLIAIIVIQVLHFVFYLSSPADKYQLQTTLEIREKLNDLEKKIDDIDDGIGSLIMRVSSLQPLEDDDDLY